MLNQRNTRIVFLLILLILFAVHWKFGLPVFAYIVLLLAYGGIMFYGSSHIQANFFTVSQNHGDRSKKQIAITFDDGPIAEFTPKVLDILKEQQVGAGFFVIGKNIAGNEMLLKRMDADGHVIGNHSYSHTFWFSMKPASGMLNDLKQCDMVVEKTIGRRIRLFRPPYGVINPMVAGAIEKGNYISIGWSLRTFDTNAKDEVRLLQKTLKEVKNGDVVLFHDWGPYTIGILSDFITEVRNKGFEIVRPDVLLGIQPYA